MKYILTNFEKNKFYTKNGILTDYLADATGFYTLEEIKEFTKKYSIKKSNCFVSFIQKDARILYCLLYNQLSTQGTKNDCNSLVFTIFKEFLPKNYYAGEIYAKINTAIDISLRNKIHEIQKITTADKASLLLLFKKCDDITLSLKVSDDGICKYCIIDDFSLIPSYYIYTQTISGEFKIMQSDCAKTYNDKGEELNGTYDILQAGRSFIFYKKL